MSLINDALRRAKDAQQQTPLPPSANPPFRPVEPAPQSVRRGPGLILPIALTAAAVLVLISAWAWTQSRGLATATVVNARTPAVPQAPTPAPVLAAQPAPVQEPATPPSPATAAPAPLAANAVSTPADEPVAGTQGGPVTNAMAMMPPPPPKPAPLRLQAIILDPKRPSAMISGRTFFVGDKLGDMRIAAISKDSAILTGASQTNILTLAE